jgi:hypothetical protein
MTQIIAPHEPLSGRTGRLGALAIPTSEEIEAAAAILKRAREARIMARRRARIAARAMGGLPAKARNFTMAAFQCTWCGLGFEARASIQRGSTGRYCSHSCRELAYQNRKRQAARRADREASRA